MHAQTDVTVPQRVQSFSGSLGWNNTAEIQAS